MLAAIGALAVTFGTVRFLDLGFPSKDAGAFAATGGPVSVALNLPARDSQATQDPRGQEDYVAAPDLLTPTAVPTTVEMPPATALLGSEKSPDAGILAPTTAILAEPTGVELQITPESEPASVETTEQLADPAPQLHWVEHRVAKGESLSKIFAQQGLDAQLLHKIVNSSKQAESLAQIRPGQRLRFQFDENNELTRLELHRNRVESLRVAIADDDINVEEVSKAVERRVSATAGIIESSLFVDGQKAGLSDGQIMELATVFGWDIDFALEIRAGDQFRVLYEEQYLDGEKLRNGPILAAEFTSRGTTFRAVRYEDGSGEVGYFDTDGQSKRRAFIRTPIKFARVSSGFTVRRWHPILKKWRSHKGVDYAAPMGTPVKATGDGRVLFRGKKNGYGNTVILAHTGQYTTVYAHLSKFSARATNGNRVKQGQVIGYVGKTGLATGPHLHYEFRVNGQHRDPLRVKLPKSLSLPPAELAAFRKTTAPLLAKLEAIPAETMVASAGPSAKTP